MTNDTTFKAAGLFPGDTVLYSVMPSDDILLVVSAAVNQQALERRVIFALDTLGVKYGLILGNMPAYKPTLAKFFKISGLVTYLCITIMSCLPFCASCIRYGMSRMYDLRAGKVGVYPQLFKSGELVGVAHDIMVGYMRAFLVCLHVVLPCSIVLYSTVQTMHDDEKLATILEVCGK